MPQGAPGRREPSPARGRVSALRAFVPGALRRNLASYNDGDLPGAWADATDEREVKLAVAAMLSDSPAPHAQEFAIHDHEGVGSWGLDQYEGLADVVAKGAFVAKHGELGAALLAHFSGRLDEPEGAFEE